MIEPTTRMFGGNYTSVDLSDLAQAAGITAHTLSRYKKDKQDFYGMSLATFSTLVRCRQLDDKHVLEIIKNGYKYKKRRNG